MEMEGKRLNKYISDAGIASRREADRLIEEGKVTIRRKSRKDEPMNEALPAQVGDRVFHGDTVFVEGKELPKKEADKVYYLYNKPRGIVCTADRTVEGNIMDAVNIPQHVSYAGRLDKDSSGLIVLTNDGELIDRMMRASGYHEKEYVVAVDRVLTKAFLDEMSEGVKILLDDDAELRKFPNGRYVKTRPCRIKVINERKFSIVLTQGYNRQIRRMCKALGYGVSSIQRTRIVNLKLGELREGSARHLTAEEFSDLQEALLKGPKKDNTLVKKEAPKWLEKKEAAKKRKNSEDGRKGRGGHTSAGVRSSRQSTDERRSRPSSSGRNAGPRKNGGNQTRGGKR